MNFIDSFMLSSSQLSYQKDNIQSKGKTRESQRICFCTSVETLSSGALGLWTAIATVNYPYHLLERDDGSIGNRDTPLELALTLQTLRDLWTHDALDDLLVDLLFAHWLALPFLSVTAPPVILPSVTVRMYCPH